MYSKAWFDTNATYVWTEGSPWRAMGKKKKTCTMDQETRTATMSHISPVTLKLSEVSHVIVKTPKKMRSSKALCSVKVKWPVTDKVTHEPKTYTNPQVKVHRASSVQLPLLSCTFSILIFLLNPSSTRRMPTKRSHHESNRKTTKTFAEQTFLHDFAYLKKNN